MNQRVECDCCGEVITDEIHTGELNDDPLCEECYYHDTAEPAAVLVDCDDGDRWTLRVGSYCIEWDDGERVDPDSDEPVMQLAKSIHWTSTDPWRGYYAFNTPEGWTNVIADWCGIDGFNLDGDLGDFHEKWQVEKDTPPFHMIVAFPRGSNVCSIIIDIFVEEGNEEAFATWLKN